jgi:hypothetical protein
MKLITTTWEKLNKYFDNVYLDSGSPYVAFSIYMLCNYVFFSLFNYYFQKNFEDLTFRGMQEKNLE